MDISAMVQNNYVQRYLFTLSANSSHKLWYLSSLSHALTLIRHLVSANGSGGVARKPWYNSLACEN
jgi:hypothetical protein